MHHTLKRYGISGRIVSNSRLGAWYRGENECAQVRMNRKDGW